MKIGLIDVDSHGKKKKWGATIYPNLALCKIAAYHKNKGDEVVWYDPIFTGHCDIVYKSKIFNFTPDYLFAIDADKIVEGGTGYDIKSQLPQCIDDTQPDLSIYPNVPNGVSYGFLTRGCPNKCFWCVVPKKEGTIKPYWDIEKVANGKKKVVLMDNNILAAGDYCLQQLQKIIDLGIKVDFNQALDARLVTEENAKLLAQIDWIDRRIRFGCDTTAQINHCEAAMDMINRGGYKGQYFLYTMIGGANGFNECYDRLMYWWHRNHEVRSNHKQNAIYPYAQPYRNPSKPNAIIPQWQKDMAQWCNKKMIFETIPFEEFKPRKNFVCKEYLLWKRQH